MFTCGVVAARDPVAGDLGLARPTQGIRHDAIYMAQTMFRVWPGVLARRVLAFGNSQDNFSVYSRLMAQVLSAGWMVPAVPVLLWLSHAGLLAGVWLLLSRSAMLRPAHWPAASWPWPGYPRGMVDAT